MPGKDVKDIINFLIYIMPGFLALRMYRAAYPGRQMSDLVMTAWSLILGVIITSIIKWIDKAYFHNHLHSVSVDFPGLPLVSALLFGGIIGGGISIGQHWARFHLAVKYPSFFAMVAPDQLSIWAKVNQPSNTDWAVVYLDNDAIYIGGITNYSTVPDIENQDFLLSDASRVGDDLSVKYKVDGSGVYLNTRNIRQIEFITGVDPPIAPIASAPEIIAAASTLELVQPDLIPVSNAVSADMQNSPPSKP